MGRRGLVTGLLIVAAMGWPAAPIGGGVEHAQAATMVPAVAVVITSTSTVLDGPSVAADGWAYAVDGSATVPHIVYAFSPTGQVMSRTVPSSYAVLAGTGGVGYIISDAGNVTAWSFPQKRPLWTTALHSAPMASPILLANGTLTILTVNGTVTSLFPLDGSTQRTVSLWSGEKDFSGTTPNFFAGSDGAYVYCLAGDTAYAAGPDGFAYSFRLSEWLNTHATQAGILSPGSFMLQQSEAGAGINGGLITVWHNASSSPPPTLIVAIDSKQGYAWKALLPVSNASYTPNPAGVLSNGDLMFGELGGSLFRISRNHIIWQSQDRLLANLSMGPLVDSKGAVYVGTTTGLVASVYARDGGIRWRVQLPFSEPVLHIAPSTQGGAWVSTRLHIYGLVPQQGFSLPMTITPQPANGKQVRWTWTWTGAKKPDSYIAVLYHYVGKTSIGDQQVQLPATATSFTATGQCGKTYYLRIRAVGAGFPATYYAPADSIALTC